MQSSFTPGRTASFIARTVALLALATLAACSGSKKNDRDSHAGFEPITCSATPSPCA